MASRSSSLRRVSKNPMRTLTYPFILVALLVSVGCKSIARKNTYFPCDRLATLCVDSNGKYFVDFEIKNKTNHGITLIYSDLPWETPNLDYWYLDSQGLRYLPAAFPATVATREVYLSGKGSLRGIYTLGVNIRTPERSFPIANLKTIHIALPASVSEGLFPRTNISFQIENASKKN
jgi:hypothetical protein